ncbi:uncharacterized protein TrAFT101_000333 [Trichoderma asperellum]|uniref:Uncharacterized protein n=1 Tax=Trichoderma asperellum (strain ATCC 204424 / CBS 433.97 / NBRC 101777) TaxID=1042311 RepID=A0A2T3ZJ77_TRIA4|nr:hypothetical protein M441DRAFT_64543 [Trichoderma asperellum CBS 433.97]PTB44864.1 hypothetical protein M441DRAFT_64543 [Trichoderma asperellum CBS 433.97]UKZ84421.1 hypothetical protein TrAFT101_000333 [Trichoderma asperellum]
MKDLACIISPRRSQYPTFSSTLVRAENKDQWRPSEMHAAPLVYHIGTHVLWHRIVDISSFKALSMDLSRLAAGEEGEQGRSVKLSNKRSRGRCMGLFFAIVFQYFVFSFVALQFRFGRSSPEIGFVSQGN